MTRPREHGTCGCYQNGPTGTILERAGCRCALCRAANRDYQRAYRARRYGKTLPACVRGLGWPRTGGTP
jgi:hypothetical protein